MNDVGGDHLADLDALAGVVREVSITLSNDRAYVIRPLTTRMIAPFARALRDVPADVVASMVNGSIDYLLLAECTPNIARAICAVVPGADEQELLDVPAAEFMALALSVFEVNADFFVNRLAPMMEAASRKLATLRAGGRSSSSG